VHANSPEKSNGDVHSNYHTTVRKNRTTRHRHTPPVDTTTGGGIGFWFGCGSDDGGGLSDRGGGGCDNGAGECDGSD